MSKYYQRDRNLFNPKSKEPFTLSRSKFDLFYQCPRCFYMDARYGLGRPSMPAFTLNTAVDVLLKNEFDLLRQAGESHELMKQYHLAAVPLNHPDLTKWRGETPETRYKGASAIHQPTNFLLTGMIDDVWQSNNGELIIVDYKSTSTSKEISLEDEYKQAYKRQMEFYQYLFRLLGFPVCDTGYFVFANATKNREKFDGKLEFDMSIIAHRGDDSWIDKKLALAKECLMTNRIPNPSENCEFCEYRKRMAMEVTRLQRTRQGSSAGRAAVS